MSYLIGHFLTTQVVQCDGFNFSSTFILCLLIELGNTSLILAEKQRRHSIEMMNPIIISDFFHCLYVPGDQGAAATTTSRACKYATFELLHCLQPL